MSAPTQPQSYGSTDLASSSTKPPAAPAAGTAAAAGGGGAGGGDKKLDKIEPKVWLANERTWLNWSRTGVLLGSFGVALVNSSPGRGAKVIGVIYTFIAIATIYYGWMVYQKRMRMIKSRHPGHFDEPLVPILIGFALLLAVLVNFILRIVDRQRSRESGGGPKNPWIAAPVGYYARSAGSLLKGQTPL